MAVRKTTKTRTKTKTIKRKPRAKPTKVTAVADSFILLDRSGSMAGRWEETLTALNAYVAELAKADVSGQVTVALFDSGSGSDFEIVRKSKPESWRPLTKDEAFPRGMTPLYDAIGKIVATADTADSDRAVIVILTDGGENSSREMTREKAKDLLDRCRAKNWQVVFLGADWDAMGQSQAIGTQVGQTLNYTSNNAASVMRCVAAGTATYAATGMQMGFTAQNRVDAVAPLDPLVKVMGNQANKKNVTWSQS